MFATIGEVKRFAVSNLYESANSPINCRNLGQSHLGGVSSGDRPISVCKGQELLSDDKGEKRLLYEALGVAEYWIIDVENVQIYAFAVSNQGSYRIAQSQVLPGLEIALLAAAFRRSRQTNHGKVSAWLLNQWRR
jgi:hypothetical protein